MKKSAILIIGLVLLVTVIGCSKSTPVENAQDQSSTVGPAIDSEINEVEQLNQELDTSELDTLEQDLNLEI